MFLKSLTIASGSQLIREINFHKGINFIVDETKIATGSEQKSGNNIGKTTVLRLIDFCLGGSDKKIYQSKEFKNNFNEEVKAFLINNAVVITLKLKADLDEPESPEITIRRNFLSRAKKLIEINHAAVDLKGLDRTLKQIIFNSEAAKPTFKQLKAKNIRDEAERLENTVKVLGNFGKSAEYEALYLFWLGVNYPDAEQKHRLLEEQKMEERLYRRLVADNSESKIQQFLNIVERDIELLEQKKHRFNINEDYESDLTALNDVRSRLNSLYTKQSQLSLRKELIEESRIELERDIASEDISQIEALYVQAKVIVPDIQKSYKDIVTFHNQMIAERVHYVTAELPNLQQQLSEIVADIQSCLSKEQQFVGSLQKADAIEELQTIINKLNELYQRKGQLEEQSTQLSQSTAILADISQDLTTINTGIQGLDKVIQKRVATFNTFFSDISDRLYGEKFALSASFEKVKGTESSFYRLYIDSLNGQTGTGKKKGEIAAFDIAYVKFADKKQIPSLHFILHDQMEVVDDNQIIGLVREVIAANCQFVVPILRDKLPKALDKPEFQVLSLSQDDKLFRI